MDLPILTAAVIGLAALSFTGAESVPLQSSSASSKAEGAEALVGERLWGSESPVSRWDLPRAEDLALEDLGRVAAVRTSPSGEAIGITVAVGGLWGLGEQEVEMGIERLRLVPAEEGARLVLDLSAGGAEPPLDGETL